MTTPASVIPHKGAKNQRHFAQGRQPADAESSDKHVMLLVLLDVMVHIHVHHPAGKCNFVPDKIVCDSPNGSRRMTKTRRAE